MKNRSLSFVFIFFVYVIATISGIILYNSLSYSPWLNLLIADVTATIVVFIFSVIVKNASVYDPYWSVQPIVIVTYLALTKSLNGIRILILVAISYWGVRLTLNWAYTFKDLTHQDWRYTMLKEKTGKFYPLVNFFGIHLFPTLVVYACMLPVLYAYSIDFNPNALSALAFAVSITATTIQFFADIEMQKFRKNRAKNFITAGLWKYSRHPNYLGEILMWWGIALTLVCSVPSLWYLSIGALINTLMFLFVSIPMADKRQSKKKGFSEYKARTRMLLPIKK